MRLKPVPFNEIINYMCEKYHVNFSADIIDDIKSIHQVELQNELLNVIRYESEKIDMPLSDFVFEEMYDFYVQKGEDQKEVAKFIEKLIEIAENDDAI